MVHSGRKLRFELNLYLQCFKIQHSYGVNHKMEYHYKNICTSSSREKIPHTTCRQFKLKWLTNPQIKNGQTKNKYIHWEPEKTNTCKGESPDAGLTPVTEQPIIKPWRRTPRYHFGPILFSWTSSNPAFWNHSIYSSSLGKSIQTSAKKRDNQNVGYTGPIRHALPPSFKTL